MEITSCKSFWLKTFTAALTWAHGTTSWTGLLTIILAIVSWRNPDWVDWVNIVIWAVPLSVFLAVLIIGLAKTPYSLFMEQAIKVEEYETEAIELDADYRFESQRGFWVARVGVRAIGQKAVRGVVVYLTYIDGNENDLRDAPLHPAMRLRSSTGAITVNPGDAQRFVEVLHWDTRTGREEMDIPYNLNYQLEQEGKDPPSHPYALPTIIDVGAHTLTLYATGEDIKPIEREFRVEIKDNELRMHRIDKEKAKNPQTKDINKKQLHNLLKKASQPLKKSEKEKS